jgi:hypothetical protein
MSVGKNYPYFRDYLCPIIAQMMVPEMLVIFKHLTQLIAQEYFLMLVAMKASHHT